MIETLLIYLLIGAFFSMALYFISYRLQFRKKEDPRVTYFLEQVDMHPFWYVILCALIWPVFIYWIFFDDGKGKEKK